MCSSYIHHSGRQALHTTHDAMLRVLPSCLRRAVGAAPRSHDVHAFSRGTLSKKIDPGKRLGRQFSAGATTTSLPAKGEMAEAKRRVETLEQEKNEMMEALMPHLKVASPSQVVIELLKPKHTKLKKSLDSLNTQLVEVNKQLTLAMKAQVPQVC